MNSTKIGILGSGVGGLTAALKLQLQIDAEIEIIERGNAPGGRVRTLDIDGNKFDVGATIITPHFLKTLDKELDVDNIETIPVDLDVIATEKREPLRLDFGLTSFDDIEKILEKGPLSTAWVLANVGIEGLVHEDDMEKLSMMQYLNELVDLPENMEAYLSAGFVAANVSAGKLEATAFDLLAYSHNFQYPTGGVGKIADKLAEAFSQRGGFLRLNSQVNSIRTTENGVEVEIEDLETNTTDTTTFDYVVSNIGVGHTLDIISDSSQKVQQAKQKLSHTEPTIGPTILMYKFKEKPEFKGRTGLNLYYPLNTVDEINEYIKSIEDGNTSINGFYIHFPALHDPKASSSGEYPIGLWFPSQIDPSDDVIDRFKKFGEEQMDKYFIDNFSEKAEFVDVFRRKDATPLYNDPGTVSQIAPQVGYPVFDTELTDRVYIAGSGAGTRFSPSTIQAQMSGLKAANLLANKIDPSTRSLWQKIKDFFKSIFG